MKTAFPKNAALWIVAACLSLQGQVPARLPLITGNAALYLMVEPDGSMKSWGRSVDKLSFGNGVEQPEQKVDEPRML